MENIPSNEELVKKFLKQKEQHRNNQMAYIKRKQTTLDDLGRKYDKLNNRYDLLSTSFNELTQKIDNMFDISQSKIDKSFLNDVDERLKKLEKETELNINSINEIISVVNEESDSE